MFEDVYMKKIGLRNIKTAISVLLCLIIYFVIILVCHIFDKSYAANFKLATQLYTPFFACLAAAYTTASTKSKSYSQAKLRLLASIIGGLFGMLAVALYQSTGLDWPFQHISATGNPTRDLTGLNTDFLDGRAFAHADINLDFLLSFIAPVIITAVAVIVVIWFCNLIKKPDCSFIAVLTLTAVMTSLGTNPVIYGPNRIMSTIIGVLISLGVNVFTIPHKKNKNAYFVFGVDDFYREDIKKFDGYYAYQIEKLIEDDAKVTIFTNSNVSICHDMIVTNYIKLPILTLSGAAVYDYSKEEYLYVEYIKEEDTKKLLNFFKENNYNYLTNVIKNNLLYVYTLSESKDKINKGYVAYIFEEYQDNKNVVSFNLNFKTYEEALSVKDKLTDYCTVISKLGDTYILNIYSKELENQTYINNIKDSTIYSFGFVDNDRLILSQTNGYTSNKELSDYAKVIPDDKGYHKLLKEVKKIYRTK
jgi:hydroxymethylpyrimidine pyrophosphatase-like HAD family hydrolase